MSNDTLTNLPPRKNIDTTFNSHSKQLVDFLRDCNMITLNGRFSNGKDNFTIISTVGKSVVDYAIVQAEQFYNYSEFEVRTVLDVLENVSIPSDSLMPDHSLVCWEYTYTDLLLNRLSQQMCGAQLKSICHVKKYSRILNKPLFKCDTLEHLLEELITELDSLTPSGNIDNKSNKLFRNYSTFYSIIENEYSNHRTKTHHSSSRKPRWNSDLDTVRKELRLTQKAWTTEQNREEKRKLWQKFKTEQRSFNLYTRKAKRRYIKERQIYLLMTKASNVKMFWKEFDSVGIHNDKSSSNELPTSIL